MSVQALRKGEEQWRTVIWNCKEPSVWVFILFQNQRIASFGSLTTDQNERTVGPGYFQNLQERTDGVLGPYLPHNVELNCGLYIHPSAYHDLNFLASLVCLLCVHVYLMAYLFYGILRRVRGLHCTKPTSGVAKDFLRGHLG
jgi:hypothetical protein